jgi:hypothetical protein
MLISVEYISIWQFDAVEVCSFLRIRESITHRRDAEDTEGAQRLEYDSTLCAISVSSVSLR